jgi:hypothetical protein
MTQSCRCSPQREPMSSVPSSALPRNLASGWFIWPGVCRAYPRLCHEAAAPVRESRLWRDNQSGRIASGTYLLEAKRLLSSLSRNSRTSPFYHTARKLVTSASSSGEGDSPIMVDGLVASAKVTRRCCAVRIFRRSARIPLNPDDRARHLALHDLVAREKLVTC